MDRTVRVPDSWPLVEMVKRIEPDKTLQDIADILQEVER